MPGLHEAVERDQKRYSNLAYCILAAVFSINARYTAVLAAVERYRRYYGLPPVGIMDVPDGTPEPPLSMFIAQVEGMGVEAFASDVLHNRMRTSSRNGVLKAQAALDYAHWCTHTASSVGMKC